jgi:hypothetical protein
LLEKEVCGSPFLENNSIPINKQTTTTIIMADVEEEPVAAPEGEVEEEPINEMADEEEDFVAVGGATEVKLFGKWSYDEIEVRDISLVVGGDWF